MTMILLFMPTQSINFQGYHKLFHFSFNFFQKSQPSAKYDFASSALGTTEFKRSFFFALNFDLTSRETKRNIFRHLSEKLNLEMSHLIFQIATTYYFGHCSYVMSALSRQKNTENRRVASSKVSEDGIHVDLKLSDFIDKNDPKRSFSRTTVKLSGQNVRVDL